MASSITVNGDGTVTISLSWTATVEVMDDTLNAAAMVYYLRKPVMVDEVVVPFDDLTNNQKLSLIEAEMLRIIRHNALGYLHDLRQAVLKEQAEEDLGKIL